MAKCDHCNAETEGTQMICVSVKSHVPDADGRAVQARVNSQRWWAFCSKTCADEWYETETDEHLMAVGPPPPPVPCEVHLEGEHDFSVPAEDIELNMEVVEDVTIASSPRCSHCGKAQHEVQSPAPHLIDSGHQPDRLLRMIAVHVTAVEGTALCDHQIFDQPHELNAYWKTPGVATPLSLDNPNGEQEK